MQHSFWEARWNSGQIGFHQDQVHPTLRQHWRNFTDFAGAGNSDGVLVPLCGKSIDLTWLSEQGHRVVGAEFVETAVESYFEELGVEPTRASNPLNSLAAGNTTLIVGDFFALEPDPLILALGGSRPRLAYDRAALVAVEPNRRQEYLSRVTRLLEPNGAIFLLSFEHDMGAGPPFSVEEVPALFEAVGKEGTRFELQRHSMRDLLLDEPRFRERGATQLNEVLWFARRVP